MDKKTNDKNRENVFILWITMLWAYTLTVQYAIAFMKRIPFVSGIAKPAVIMAFIILLLFSVKHITQSAKSLDLCLFILVIITIFVHYLIFKNNRQYIEAGIVKWIFNYIPMYFVGLSVINNLDDRLMDFLSITSVITVFLFTFYKIVISPLESTMAQSGDMFAAYNILPHICLAIYSAFKRKNIINIFAAIVGIIILPTMGNRGTLLCLACFIALIVLFIFGRKHPLLTAFIIIFSTVILLYTPIFENTVIALRDWAIENNMSTRVFDKILAQEVSEDIGRNKIASIIWGKTLENSLTGMGIMADRYILATSAYAHNILLELLLNFGIPVGGILFISIIVLIIRAIKSNLNNPNILCLVFIAFGSGFIKLFMSGSYIQEPYFFLLIGLCVGAIRKTKQT